MDEGFVASPAEWFLAGEAGTGFDWGALPFFMGSRRPYGAAGTYLGRVPRTSSASGGLRPGLFSLHPFGMWGVEVDWGSWDPRSPKARGFSSMASSPHLRPRSRSRGRVKDLQRQCVKDVMEVNSEGLGAPLT